MTHAGNNDPNKVPDITALFWVIKIIATTLGETAGDALSMTLGLGYAASSILLFSIFGAVCYAQIRANRLHPFLYWSVVIATTTVGTTVADFADRSLGLGYPGGVAALALLLAIVLAVWRASAGTISAAHVADRRQEGFYWLAILASNTLGTALGDFAADGAGLGYGGGSLVFLSALSFIVALRAATETSPVILFWAAFVLTRPLGATVGDLLTKPVAKGGLDLGAIASSGALVALIAVLVALTVPRGSASRPLTL